MEKLDIVMWTVGKPTLLPCVRRITQVIPRSAVNNKYLIVKGSNRFVEVVAQEYGWNVVRQNGVGIGDAAQTALDQVETPFFMSFEDDLLLCKDWFPKVFRHMKDPKVAVAQGWRVSTNPTIRAFNKIGLGWFRDEKRWSIDNNIYRTEVIRKHGFDTRSKWFSDSILIYQVRRDGWKWITDASVISQHLNVEPMLHYCQLYERRYADSSRFINTCVLDSNERKKYGKRYNLLRGFVSPIVGTGMALRTHTPMLLVFYVLFRLYKLRGSLKHG